MMSNLTKIEKLEKENKELRTQINNTSSYLVSKSMSDSHALSEELERANEFLVAAQSLANIGHWEWNIIDGDIRWSNQIFNIFGFEEQSFTPTYEIFLNTIHENDRDLVSSSVNDALENRAVYDIQHRIILPDSSQRIVHEIGYAVYSDQGLPLRMIGTVQDITKMNLMQKELKEQKESFENIFENAHDGMSLVQDGVIISCNKSLVNMLKVKSKEEILNKLPAELSPEYQEDGILSSIKAIQMIELCLQKGFHQFEWLHMRPNGELFLAEILLTKLNILGKNVFHASWRDISDRKFLENALVSSNDKYKTLVNELDHRVKEQSAQLIKQSKIVQMGELLSMIAHQWRQPLGSIAAVVINLKMKFSLLDIDKTDSKSLEDLSTFTNIKLDDIDRYTQSLSQTIDDFRNLYKSGTNLINHPITKPINDALELIEMALTAEKIKIEKNYNTKVDVNIQNNEIMQVILSIIKNAQDNFKDQETKKPIISITTTETNDSVFIMIDDNGGGIDESIVDEIFNPYFSTKDEKNGTGLGLYMCKLIIEQNHKGSIGTKNTPIGASFIIELPKANS